MTRMLVLEATTKGDVTMRLQAMTTIVVSVAAERFGLEVGRGDKQLYTKNQRQSWTGIIIQARNQSAVQANTHTFTIARVYCNFFFFLFMLMMAIFMCNYVS